jgi:formyl-CoA transferase
MDGVSVLIAIQNETEWQSLCDVFLGDPSLATDPRFEDNPARVVHREELNAIVGARFATLDDEAAVALLERSRVAYAHLNPVTGFVDHPVLAARRRWHPVATPNGPVEALLPPANLAGIPARMDPVPAVGEHTDAILTELGYSPSDITALHDAGAV